MDECQNKGDRKWAICKWLKRKGGDNFGGMVPLGAKTKG
jgi:hypothetical protein